MTISKYTCRLPVPIEEFAKAIVDWYSLNRRDLPWRKTNDPYHIWVSEVMLQQTQVRTVIPYYQRFLRVYPRLELLAEAKLEEVLDCWAGLGYYSRARNLHRAAQTVAQEHDGRFPADYEDALKLPGVGRYSAGAVLSIAYRLPHPVLDGNVGRILARYLKIDQPVKGPVLDGLWKLLGYVVKEPFVASRISDFNQGLMELGALICLPVNPDCRNCPLSATCAAFKDQTQSKYPVKTRRARSVELNFVSALVRRDHSYLMLRNSEGPFLKGFWEFPRVEGNEIDQSSIRRFREVHGLDLICIREIEMVSHAITFRKLKFRPFEAGLKAEPPEGGFAWVRPGNIGFPLSAYIRKILKQVDPEGPDIRRSD